MKPAPFAYARPETLAEATDLLQQGDGSNMIIAGGQSLLILMGLRITIVETLVDISRLPEIARVESSADRVFLGAATTHARIEDGEVPDPSLGLMPRVASNIAYRAVRNMGTIGGSMALADPSADWPACLSALAADVVIAGKSGQRRELASSFLRGPYSTSLEPGEIILGFDIPRLRTSKWGTAKVARKSGAFADSMAVFVDAGDGNPPRIALTGTSSHARLLPRAAAHLEAVKGFDAAGLREAVIADLAEIEPDADDYQVRCHVSTVSRAVREARA